MSLAKNLSGLTPARRLGGAPNGGGQNLYRIANGLAQDLFAGDPVKLTVGVVQRCSATTDFAMGVFMGCKYVDPNSKRPTWSQMWTSATSSADGTPYAYVVDDPNATFFIGSDASVTLGDTGLNFPVTLGTGNTFTQRSGYGLKAASRATTSALLRVLGIKQVPGNAFGDPFPIVEVKFVQDQQTRVSAGVGA